MDFLLKGKTALVTGASRGIGRAIAQTLAREGCDLILTARDKEALNEVAVSIAKAYAVEVAALPCDISSEQGIETLCSQVGELDILVNNAGAVPGGSLAKVAMKDWKNAWDLKVFGYINLSQALYEKLEASRGVIVNIIGVAGEYLMPEYIVGSSGNAALMAFTRSLGKEASKTGVRVVAVNPGPVATERWQKLVEDIAESDPEKARIMASNLPMGRPADPDEIANAVAFLASPLSAYTTGAVLTVDGGGG